MAFTTLLAPVLMFTAIGALGGGLLWIASRRFAANDDPVIADINRLLPQTQCAQCGYPGCRPYAEAVAAGEAINRCPPGGDDTVVALARLLGRSASPVNPDLITQSAPVVARIRENECIGCRLCLDACPVDAIVGAPQHIHTVITAECTGCELCLPPCPVDCIDLLEVATPAAVTLPEVTGACIHCGLCEPVCPRALAPQRLLEARLDLVAAEAIALDDCVECGLCDRACPSDINLTANFHVMKRQLTTRRQADEKAKAAETRFEAHQARAQHSAGKVRQRPSDINNLLGSIREDIE